ncbi:MAG: hypothetical protein QOE70_1051 [Chthoniobacter sp.]|nr:hypothetical protein [Chthoniobacter sp.]
MLLVLALAGFFVVKAAIDAYLRSERFRTFLAHQAGATLRAETEIAPLHFATSSIYTEQVRARGRADADFSGLQVDGLRAELSWSRFFAHVWQVDQVDVQRLRIDLEGERAVGAPTDAAPTRSAPPSPSGRSGWLPNRVEISAATVHEAQLTWAGGGLRGTALQIKPADGGWSIEGAGGKIEHATLPALEVQRLALRYREPSLFVNNAEFRQGSSGSVSATGEINFSERLDLHATLQNIAITPYLAGDWRLRLKGDASGEIAVRCALPLRGPPEISGKIALTNGQLEALPFLNQIADFTQTQQFRRLGLSRATADFTQSGPRLTVRNLVAESEGLIRIEGGFFSESDQIDGTFQVGVTPASLQWLPGSQTRVFTESRGGYLWAPMRLTGPLASPNEDLSSRLLVAAGGAVIEGVEKTVNDSAKTLKDAAKSALDLFLAPPK